MASFIYLALSSHEYEWIDGVSLNFIKLNANLYRSEWVRNTALLPAHIPLWFTSLWLKTGRRNSFIQPEELMGRFILGEIFANDGHQSYSGIYPLLLWTSLCICDGDRIDSWQQTPPSVFPPPDTWAVSAPEIREPLLSVWLCNLLSDELSPTWMRSPVLKRCILGDVPQPFPSQQIILSQGSSPEPERSCMCRSLPEEEESFIHPQRGEIALFNHLFNTFISVHECGYIESVMGLCIWGLICSRATRQGSGNVPAAVLLPNHSMSIVSRLIKFLKLSTRSLRATQTFSIDDASIWLLKAKSKAFKRHFDSQQFQRMISGFWKEWQG